MSLKIGDKAIVTTDGFFYAPDGQQYRAVFGEIKGIHSDSETLGIATNRHSSNWYLEIGNVVIAGCQIHYAVKSDSCSMRDCKLGDKDMPDRRHIYFAE